MVIIDVKDMQTVPNWISLNIGEINCEIVLFSSFIKFFSISQEKYMEETMEILLRGGQWAAVDLDVITCDIDVVDTAVKKEETKEEREQGRWNNLKRHFRTKKTWFDWVLDLQGSGRLVICSQAIVKTLQMCAIVGVRWRE